MISFKPLNTANIRLVHQWLQLPEIKEFWDDGHRRLWQVKRHYLKDDLLMRFIILIANQPVGYIQRYPIETHHPFWKYTKSSPSVGVDFFIGETTLWGKGLGEQIMSCFIRQFCSLASEIIVDPESRNHRARRCYQKIGFAPVAEIKEANKTHQLMSFEREISPAKRIMVIGRPGGGKSTFAVKLKTKLHLPLHHLDRYFFLANWVERDYQEFLLIQQELVDSEEWIIDGNSTKSLELRYAETDSCFYLNFPRWLCYWRVFKRLWSKKNPLIKDRAPHCKETVRKSLLTYMWNYESRINPLLETLQLKYPEVHFIEIQSDRELVNLEKSLFLIEK